MKRLLIFFFALLLLLPLAAPAQEDALVPALCAAPMTAADGMESLPLFCGPTQGFYRQAGQTLDLSLPFVLFGADDCWAMAAQGTEDAFGPVGWVEAAALAAATGADVPALPFDDALPAMIEEDAPVTDNPLAEAPYSGWDVTLPRGTQVIALAALGDWLYVQCEIGGMPARVFVPAACVL